MALINCRECGKSASSSAYKCPHCGARSPSQFNYLFKVIGIPVYVICAFVFIYFVLQTLP